MSTNSAHFRPISKWLAPSPRLDDEAPNGDESHEASTSSRLGPSSQPPPLLEGSGRGGRTRSPPPVCSSASPGVAFLRPDFKEPDRQAESRRELRVGEPQTTKPQAKSQLGISCATTRPRELTPEPGQGLLQAFAEGLRRVVVGRTFDHRPAVLPTNVAPNHGSPPFRLPKATRPPGVRPARGRTARDRRVPSWLHPSALWSIPDGLASRPRRDRCSALVGG